MQLHCLIVHLTGGGSVADTETHSLSLISLRWMLRECAIAQTGILFDNAALRRNGIPLSTFRQVGAFDPFEPLSRPKGGSPHRRPALDIEGLPSADHVLQTATVNGVPNGHVETGLGLTVEDDSAVPRPSGETHTSDDHYKMASEDIDKEDALAPIHEQIKKPKWWLLEIIPLIQIYQDEDGNWHKKLRSVPQSSAVAY